jgi:hypothetical protein
MFIILYTDGPRRTYLSTEPAAAATVLNESKSLVFARREGKSRTAKLFHTEAAASTDFGIDFIAFVRFY